MLKIGIDVYSALHSPRGMGIYTINFLKYLAQIDKENQYILYGDIEDSDNVLPKQNNFELKVLNSKGFLHYEQIALPKECKRDRLDILHSPANTSPIFLDKRIKRYITLHDVIFLKREIPFSKNKKQFWGRFYYAITTILNARRAEKIFTVSGYSKEDIANTLRIDKLKIEITYNGHEHIKVETASNIDELKMKYRIPNEYFFHLGADAPSKNTKFLLEYFTKNIDKNIVIAGIRKLENSHLFAEYSKYPNIYFVPYISQKDLVGLYKNAKAFIFASLYEGFGIPLLEAMKCNCPIVCSNASCLPEIAGEAALYFNPKNEKEFIEAINLIDNSKEQLLSNASATLEKFSWAKTAEKVLETYKSIG